jgi:dimethylaniline monooxygenase (N-oxide forming)
VRLRTRVLSVTRRTGGGHVVTYKADGSEPTRTWECDAVAICSGLHVDPNIADIRGIENVPLFMHSSEFKSREQFGDDQTIMIVGSGETGADIAYLAVTSTAKRVLLCHRDGMHFAPKVSISSHRQALFN